VPGGRSPDSHVIPGSTGKGRAVCALMAIAAGTAGPLRVCGLRAAVRRVRRERERLDGVQPGTPAFHHVGDRICQRGDIERLRDEGVATGLTCDLLVRRERMRSDRNDEDVLGFRVGLQLTRRLPAADAGHLQVHEDHRGMAFADLRQRGFTARHTDDLEASELEVLRKHFAAVWVIIDDQNVRPGRAHDMKLYRTASLVAQQFR